MARRNDHAARRRREREEHVAKQGKTEPLIPRDCGHTYVLRAGCRDCQRYADERAARGLARDPYDIPY